MDNSLTTFGITSLITVLGAAATAFILFKNNAHQASKQTVELQRERIDLLEIKLLEQDQRITNLTGKIAELNGQLTEKVNQLQMFERIFQDRDPATQTHMEFMESAIRKLLKERNIPI